MIIDGKQIKEKYLDKIKEEITSKKITLAVIQVGNDEASSVYVKQKEKMCAQIGANFNHYTFDETTSEEEIINLINKLNKDETTGILVQLPLPPKFNKDKIINTIKNEKDVDGLTDENIIKLVKGEHTIIPCTTLGVMKILEEINAEIEGKHAVIIGRSNLIGKPLYNLLLNKNATVTMCHSHTKNLKEICLSADILVCATNKKHLVTSDMVKKGSILIDVGIIRENGKLYGNADYENIKNITSYITPVPGGVGPLTIAMLANNLLEACKMQER